jgi:uncharacterized membrane protein YphA (DoxX/SURF4 family)
MSENRPSRVRGRVVRCLRWVTFAVAGLVSGLAALWALGAAYFDFPLTQFRVLATLVFALCLVSAVVFVRGYWRKLTSVCLLCAMVLAGWLTLRPSNDRPWLADVDRTAWAEIHGDEVTLHHVRNFDYRTEHDFTPRWESRSVRISQLTGIDLAITYWGSPYLAHPILSFQFADAPPLCFSIESRKETGESYSAIGGIYRRFELIYIVADERDVIRLRTNYRENEDVYLYRLNVSPEEARTRLREYLASLNRLHTTPAWYHAITNNCTTSIRTQRHAAHRGKWDWRLLINGKADEWLFETRAIGDGKLDFPTLKKRSRINDDANAANDSPDFSSKIRAHAPTFHP